MKRFIPISLVAATLAVGGLFVGIAQYGTPTATIQAQAPAVTPATPAVPTTSVPAKPAVKPFKSLVRSDISAKPGELIIIRSEAAGEVAWMFNPMEFDSRHSDVDGGKLTLTTTKPGQYVVQMVAWDERKIQNVLVTVDGVVPVPPGPGPGPGPNPPDPSPVDGLAAEIRKWLEAVPKANYSKEKAEKIASAYITIASQGSDPARNAGWNLESFRSKTKEMNWTALSTDDIAAWAVPFFKPLAEKQAKMFTERSLSTTDVKGIATLWMETGEAIKKAAY